MKKISLISFFATVALMACAAAPPPVNGTWDVAVTAAEGATYFKLDVTVDGEAANGMIGDEPFSGTFSEGQLNLRGAYYVPEAGYSAELVMDVTLEDDQLKGSATWDQFEADVSGTRAE